jgi:hypothetical protein
MLNPLLGDGLFISDGETWRLRRRVVAPIVHASRMSLFAPTVVEAAAETAERWARLPPSAPIDALREMATLTAEIICRALFGPQLGDEHANAIVAAFSDYQRLVGQLDLAYLVGLPDWVPRFHPPRPDDPDRVTGYRCSLVAASAPAAVGEPRPFHTGTVLARKCAEPGTVQLCPVQRRPAGLRRSGFRVDGGDPVLGDSGPARKVAPCPQCRG